MSVRKSRFITLYKEIYDKRELFQSSLSLSFFIFYLSSVEKVKKVCKLHLIQMSKAILNSHFLYTRTMLEVFHHTLKKPFQTADVFTDNCAICWEESWFFPVFPVIIRGIVPIFTK